LFCFLQVREDIEEQLKLGKQLRTKQAEDESTDEEDDEEPSLKPMPEIPKKISTEIPLILAPSQIESEANPWLTTTTTSPVLPSSEYSKPTEVRNEETSSSESEAEDEKENEDDKPPPNESYGVTSTKLPEQLNMPVTTKRVAVKPQETEEHQMNIQEAFADDDVLAEFEKEKAEITERDRPKAIDLSLPGWGEWAGSGVRVNKRKRRT
jgi:U3 small nucleolar RNA-associated protein 14